MPHFAILEESIEQLSESFDLVYNIAVRALLVNRILGAIAIFQGLLLILRQ